MSLARAKVVALVESWGLNAFVPIVRKKDADKFKSWDDLNKPERTVGVTLEARRWRTTSRPSCRRRR